MGAILSLFVIILVVGLLFFGGIVGLILSVFKGFFSFGQSVKNSSRNNGEAQQASKSSSASKKKKMLFDKSEAEDAVYEEIKS